MTMSYFPYVTLIKEFANNPPLSSSKLYYRFRREDVNISSDMTIFNWKKNIRMSLIKQISMNVSS